MGKKMNLTELAGKGAQKLKKALEKFFNDSQIINEIYDKIDKELFFSYHSGGKLSTYRRY